LLEGGIEVDVFLVEPVDDDDLGEAVFGGIFPDLIGADADAVVALTTTMAKSATRRAARPSLMKSR
jgi:hypothetical protein